MALIAANIAAAVEEQGAATAEIARNVQQTARSAQEVTTTIGGVSQAATETGAAAAQVLGAAGDLSRQAEQLTSEVGSFIAEVRVSTSICCSSYQLASWNRASVRAAAPLR